MEKFNGTNFQVWKFQINAVLIASGIDDVVMGTRVKPEEIDVQHMKTWVKDDAKAMFLISSAMKASQVESVLTCRSSREMWNKLVLIHEQKSESNKLILTQRFHEAKMESNDTVVKHVSRILNMAAQLADVGEKMSDVAIMAKILASLPPRFNALKTAWDSVDTERQTLENLQERLIKEESRITVDDEGVSAFLSTRNAPKKGPIRDKSNMECYNCHKKGHFAWQCPQKKKKKKDAGQNCAFMAMSSSRCNELRDSAEAFAKMDAKDVWLLDSGASRHITFRREWFESFSPCTGEKVMLGDDCACDVRGSGTIKIRKIVNNEWLYSTIENVLFVPQLRKNLLPVGASVSKGFEVNFSDNRVLILKNGITVAEGSKQSNDIHRLFFVASRNSDSDPIEANTNESICNLRAWHERFGHVNIATLRKMINEGFITGASLTDSDNFFCEPCQFGKSHRFPFKKAIMRKTWKIGESFHSDVCGPMSVESLGGARYFITFIDDASGYRYVLFARSKAQVPEKFREFAKSVETKFEHPLKVFRSDNGTEYVNEDLSQ